MRNKKFILVITFLIILSWNSQSFSLKEETHQAINEHVAQNTVRGFSLTDYLINNLGFKKGVEEVLNGIDAKGNSKNKEIFWWLGYGGLQEDRPGSNLDYILNNPTRSVNHFHNPFIDLWDQAGLDDTVFGISFTGQSSILWSQNPDQYVGGEWSWQDARNYFYSALTATSESEREKNYANTFRALGQLMHLVEDASVPAHVRNDIHIPNPIYPHYEQKVEAFRTQENIYGTFWNDLLANPITFDKSILDISSTHPSAPAPIARIIDTDLYIGDNPDVTTTVFGSPQNIGVAEYANANFLSKDTMFTDDLNADHRHYFPYPNGSSATLWTDTSNNRDYLKKTGSGDAVNHLAVASFLYNFRLNYFPQFNHALPVGLDDKCYKDYASLLIPRAVGYSAGLLDYFFRGKMSIIQISSDIFQIINLSDEDMEGNLGSFTLYYDDIDDNRNEIPLAFFDSSGNQYTNPDTVVSIPGQTTSAFTVQFLSSPVNPKNKGYYTLVFKGRFGNEGAAPYDTDYAVVAQMITPHFLAAVKFDGQQDIYEYDLLGNRVYNLTQGFPRGVGYYTPVPNPVNPDQVLFLQEGCCEILLTRSTGQYVSFYVGGNYWWSKDGQRIYAAPSNLGVQYYELSTETWTGISFDTCGYILGNSSFSPDESKLVSGGLSVGGKGGDYDVWIFTNWNITDVMDMKTKSMVSVDVDTCVNYVSDEEFRDGESEYHPSEDKIIFYSNVDGSYDSYYGYNIPHDIYLADLGTRSVTRLTGAPSGDWGYTCPAWSPDGEWILMARPSSGIYLMPSSGGTPEIITSEGTDPYHPRWIGYLGQ